MTLRYHYFNYVIIHEQILSHYLSLLPPAADSQMYISKTSPWRLHFLRDIHKSPFCISKNELTAFPPGASPPSYFSYWHSGQISPLCLCGGGGESGCIIGQGSGMSWRRMAVESEVILWNLGEADQHMVNIICSGTKLPSLSPLISCITLDKLLDFTMPQLCHL